ncbi:Multidrug resistance protein MdtA precursor [Planctomycetes bacterium Poly30]|uniref:Multidrug resistance protein MdtA n=1 Tax=Saltatorellus ferox TaxID=2528018 RepID=A0A518ENY7_9BACT|nr:Multidrug resistance protein MdtA precursor [Planctomycetes bacterium Poly30]
MASPIQTAGRILRYVAPVLVIAVAVVAARAIIAAKKAPPKVERAPRVLPVEVARAQPITAAPTYEAYGVVRPLNELSVRPVVGGPVVEVHPNMIAGGRVKAGELLFRVDPRDYELSLATARAALLGSEANLAIEEGSAAVAKSEWELLEDAIETTDAGKSLALREPYLKRQRAEVESARANVGMAELNLERTSVRAPFDAVILTESLEVGSQVSPGTEVARIVATGSFLVEVNIPAERTGALDFSGTPATIRLSDADGSQPREGELLRLAGEVDTAGRMARAQIALIDPLSGSDPMLLGSYVRVDVPLQGTPDALSIPRSALREGDVVWLARDGKELAFQPVTVTHRRNEDVLISSGLKPGQEVITSPIAVPVPGTALRVLDGTASSTPSAGGEMAGGADQ